MDYAAGIGFVCAVLLQAAVAFGDGTRRGLLVFVGGFGIILLIWMMACAVTLVRHGAGRELGDTFGFGALAVGGVGAAWFFVGLAAFVSGLLLRALANGASTGRARKQRRNGG